MSDEMPGQLEAFPAPLIAVSLTAWYEPGRGWSLRCSTRREGQGFSRANEYERLVRSELLDVLLEEAVGLLELSDYR